MKLDNYKSATTVDVNPNQFTTFTVSLSVLMRCVDDVKYITGGEPTPAGIESWLTGYSEAGLCIPAEFNPTEEYEAGYAYGYAADQYPPEEH